MANKLLDFYKSVLGFCSMYATNEGFIKLTLAGSEAMCMIEGKSLVLPTEKRLKDFDYEKEIIFHPMTESIVRAESEVQEKLRMSFVAKMNFAVFTLMGKLLEIAKDKAKHANLNPEQAEFLRTVQDVDQTCYDNFRDLGVLILNGKKVEWKFMDMRLKKGGIYKGKKVDKLGVVFFPFYEKLVRKDLGKMRVCDSKIYKAVFEYLFNVVDEDAYNRPCHGNAVAPYFTSFLATACAVSIPINDLSAVFKDHLDEDETTVTSFNADWHDQLVNIESLLPSVRKIPAQMGNLGRVEPIEAEKEPVRPVVNMLQTQEAPAVSNTLSGLAAAVHLPQQTPIYHVPAPVVNDNEAPSLSSAVRAAGMGARFPVATPMGMNMGMNMGMPNMTMGMNNMGMMNNMPMGMNNMGMMNNQMGMGGMPIGMMSNQQAPSIFPQFNQGLAIPAVNQLPWN